MTAAQLTWEHGCDPRDRMDRLADAARAASARGWIASFDRDLLWKQIVASSVRARTDAPARPLEGHVVAVKDQVDVAGMPTRCGTGFYRGRAAVDAQVVERLREAGAIVLAKATMHELALGSTGRNRHDGDAQNPWDPTRDTGGSSSGSAALVAAGIVSIAVGTDLGGSVRIPGSLCGAAALKPTFGAISKVGVVPVAPSLEHVGLFARDVLLLARAFSATSNAEPLALCPRRVRIGYCERAWRRASADVRRIASAALDALVASGRAELVCIALPDLDAVTDVGAVLSSAEAARAWGWALEVPSALRGAGALSPATRIALAVGRRISDSAIVKASLARDAIRARLDACFRDVDVVATPTTMSVASPYAADGAEGELDESAMLERVASTMLHNLTGTPALQIPCGFAACGMPIGLQLAGRAWSEPILLKVGAWIEGAVERRHPSLHVVHDVFTRTDVGTVTSASHEPTPHVAISCSARAEWEPLVIEPPASASKEEARIWLGERLPHLARELPSRGAVLMRGFDVSDAEGLADMLKTLGIAPKRYIGGDSPRTDLGSSVYSSTDAPPAIKIPLHNELSYLHTYPRYLFMACSRPAMRGGETILANGRRVLAGIDPEVRERFARLGVAYRCTLRGRTGAFATLDEWFKVKKSWMEAFDTGDEVEAERRCKLVADRVSWGKGGQLVFESTRPSLVDHPLTGEQAWFNQAHLFHLSPRYLGPLRFAAARALFVDPDTRPHHATYGDGSAIDAKTRNHVLDVLDQHTVAVRWQRGDFLWLDNLVTMHGREPFEGPRRVMVALGDP